MLCDLAVQDQITVYLGKTDLGSEFFGDPVGPYRSRSSIRLPDGVARWADILTDPWIRGHGKLSRLNDSGTTFEEIADLIEQYL